MSVLTAPPAPPPPSPPGVGTLVVVGLVLLAAYVALAAFWPYVRCPRCKGTGKRRAPLGGGWRDCPRCDGRGRAVRLGRRLYESARGFDS